MSSPTIPTEFRVLGPVSEIPDAFVVPYYVDDLKLRIAIARVDGRLHAFDDLCTCGEPACPLSGGLLSGGTIMCQCHGSRFDLTSGAVIDGPSSKALRVHEVEERDGTIRVRVNPGTSDGAA